VIALDRETAQKIATLREVKIEIVYKEYWSFVDNVEGGKNG
jgi:hypothetical protein